MSPLINQIRNFEQQSAMLEPGAEERRRLLSGINAYLEEFLHSLESRPAFQEIETRGQGIYDSPISESGMDLDAVLRLFRDNVVDPGSMHASARFLAYIPTAGLYLGALGDLLAAVTNKYSGDFFNCPGGVRMENQVLRWLADLAGYPASARGNLASGGSVAMLTAIVTAREAHGLKSRDYDTAVIYLTGHAHHSIQKALHIAGLGGCIKRDVPMDESYRMDPAQLERLIEKDAEQGLKPWMVVGSAGTTNLGSIDPLADIGEIAGRRGLWFHIDGAYGGPFILSDLVTDRFRGIERSDSVVMNPHKALYTPFGLGAVLVRNGELLYRAHRYTADYMQDTFHDSEEISPADLGPELTRPFRALPLWLALKVLGIAPFRAALSEKILLARYAYERLCELDGFEMGPYPDLSVFAFRCLPERGDANAFNRELAEELRRDGSVLLSTTAIDGKFMIRVAILSFRTHKDDVDLALDKIEHYIKKLSAG